MVDINKVLEEASKEMNFRFKLDTEFLKKFQENLSAYSEEEQGRILRAFIVGYKVGYESRDSMLEHLAFVLNPGLPVELSRPYGFF